MATRLHSVCNALHGPVERFGAKTVPRIGVTLVSRLGLKVRISYFGRLDSFSVATMPRDHYVAQTYFRHFADANGFLQVCRKSDALTFPARLEAVCHELAGDIIPDFLENPKHLGEYRKLFEPHWNEAISELSARRWSPDIKDPKAVCNGRHRQQRSYLSEQGAAESIWLMEHAPLIENMQSKKEVDHAPYGECDASWRE